jgi:glyoxylase-like metal-dependent hydrolase (beta-lactamase superfamily II)
VSEIEAIDLIDQDEAHLCVLPFSFMPEPWVVDVLLVGTGYSSTCTLATSPSHRILIDTGLSVDEDRLLSALDERRLRPEDIDIVVNTHLHVDHCGNNSIFARATIFMLEAEWRWTQRFYSSLFSSRAPERVTAEFYPEISSYGLSTRTIRNVARMARMFWDEKRLGAPGQLRWLEEAALPAGLDVLSTPGHTPHHISIRVAAASPVIVAGDAVLAEDAEAPIKTMVPFSRAQFTATRAALLEHGLTIVPGHGPAFVPRPASLRR